MKHKTNIGPGLIVALGAPSDNAGKMDVGSRAPGEGTRPTGPDAISNAANMDTVPLDMLSMPDDQEQMQPPEVGDVVNYQVTGKVVAIEGNVAKVQRQSINGQDLPDAEPNEANSDNTNPENANQDGGSSTGGGGSATGDRTTGGDDEASGLRNQAAGIGMLT